MESATAGWAGVVKVWDVATGQELMDLPGHTSTVAGVAAPTDHAWRRLVETATESGIRHWQTFNCRVKQDSFAVLFSRDGSRLVRPASMAPCVFALRLEDLVNWLVARHALADDRGVQRFACGIMPLSGRLTWQVLKEDHLLVCLPVKQHRIRVGLGYHAGVSHWALIHNSFQTEEDDRDFSP
jgi:WD40 repeat protein